MKGTPFQRHSIVPNANFLAGAKKQTFRALTQVLSFVSIKLAYSIHVHPLWSEAAEGLESLLVG